jgi:hypothetical protein
MFPNKDDECDIGNSGDHLSPALSLQCEMCRAANDEGVSETATKPTIAPRNARQKQTREHGERGERAKQRAKRKMGNVASAKY